MRCGTVRSLSRKDEIEAALGSWGMILAIFTLYQADLMSADGRDAAVKGCDYVMHIASVILGVPKYENELIAPAVSGADFVVSAASGIMLSVLC